VVAGPNGGYLGATIARAVAAETAGRPLRSLAVQYLRAPAAGAARIAVTVERAGRSVTFATARFEQEGRTCALAQAVLATERESLRLDSLRAPEVAPPEEIEPAARPAEAPPFAHRFDFRQAIGAAPFAGADEALTGGWLRFREPAELDAAALVALTDSWFPAIFAVAPAPMAVPTLDLTVHLRAPLPRPHGWVLGLYRTGAVRDGFLDEDSTLWSREGELLAHGRQLALAV